MRHGILICCLAAAVGAQAQGDPETLKRIIDEGKNRNQVMKHLDYLTHQIGPRLTGSTRLQMACDWTAKKFKEFGCKNVHLEQWGTVKYGFDRGASYARVISPLKYDLEFTSPSWSIGTNGPVRGKILMEPATVADITDAYKGAWVLVTSPTTRPQRGAPPEPDPKGEALEKAGIAGRIYASRTELTITSGNIEAEPDKISKTPRITIRNKDMKGLMAKVEKGPVEIEIDLSHTFKKGPVPVYNVIAEIPGTEKPEEVVIVSGHLDSWDGPGSQGAQDNGTGTMVALEAARILNKVGAKPKRTIRFIMWTGEEQGLFGSRKYVEMHEKELDKISCVFVDDGGTNYEGGLTCNAEMEPMLKEAQKPMEGVFPDMPFTIRVAARIPRGGGSDHASFNAKGVPGFFWNETGRGDYNYVHHTQYDRYETAIPEYLIQSSTNSAVMAFNIACAATMLPRDKAESTTTAPARATGS